MLIEKFHNFLFKAALSRHFRSFLAKTIQKSFFLTFPRAKNIALKFRTNKSINFSQEEYSMVHLWFCLKDGSFEKSRLNFSKCIPSPSMSSATTRSSKQSLCSYLVFSNQTYQIKNIIKWLP